MTISFGVTWVAPSFDRRIAAFLAVVMCFSVFGAVAARSSLSASAGLTSVIVREASGAGSAPERAVRAAGGSVERQIGIIDGFSAAVPSTRVDDIATTPGVLSVTPNGAVRLSSEDDDDAAANDEGSMASVRDVVGAGAYWSKGYTGKGVDVALIDSGVAPVKGLTDKVVYGPDLSFESQSDNLRHLDTFGHGTHMAGIIAGRDPNSRQNGEDRFLGVAPDARVISLKVAAADGSTDVSQVLAAIDWVVQHRHDDGMDIRVLNLSFGTDGTQDYMLDPLTYAVEVAWKKGIFVVVAAGNKGYGSTKLNNPAYDPYVMAVGAADANGTYGTADDVVADFSSVGDAQRHPDLVAPGKSVQSLRVPGSYIDGMAPSARVGDPARLFRGSGTSQSAAAVSGAAALVLQQRPSITPDELKKLFMSSASRLPNAKSNAQGSGMIDLKRARDRRTPSYVQSWPSATGLGSVELARGSQHVVDAGVELRGEQDIFGKTLDTATWAPSSLEGSTWSGGTWNGSTWSGSTWSGSTWSGSTWSGSTWSGSTWSGSTWSGSTWSGSTWSGSTWSGSTWSGSTWSGSTWS